MLKTLQGTPNPGLIVAVLIGLATISARTLGQDPWASAGEVALTGMVRSAAEGPMEGVLVSARRDGSTRTVTVVSRADGRYAFPRERLDPGTYAVSIRAVGYALPGTSSTMPVGVMADRVAVADLDLREANILEKALQLTDPEWLASYPLDEEEKFDLRNCSRCHSLQRASMSTYNEEEMAWVMKRMLYSSGSTPMTFQLPATQTETWGRAEWGEPSATHRREAAIVARINLHDGMWDYDLQTMPRPSGPETDVIYTTWDLPVTARPHDTRIGLDGNIWFNHFNDNALGRLDPRTGEVREWRWPYMAEEGSFAPTGARTIMGPDANGRFYIGNQAQDGLVVFDPSTEAFEFLDPPGDGEMMDVSASGVDGYGWRSDSRAAFKIDLETWEYVTVEGERPLARYDIAADPENGLFGGGRGSPYIWHVDGGTLEVSYFDIPDEPRGVGGLGTGMRRGIADSMGRLWWGGFDGNFVGMLDPGRAAHEAMTLFPVPYPYFMPYDAHYDERGYTWTGGIYADRVARFDPATGDWDFFLLPFKANIRDIDLQPSIGGPSGLWIGHTHEAKISLVEPLSE